MPKEILENIIALAQTTAPAFLATADIDGLPHIAAVGKVVLDSGSRIRLDDWLCPQTVENLDANHNACLVIWDCRTNNGFQLTGRLLSIHDTAVMDGYSRKNDSLPPLPQVERQLLFEVTAIYEFRHGIHSDASVMSGIQK